MGLTSQIILPARIARQDKALGRGVGNKFQSPDLAHA